MPPSPTVILLAFVLPAAVLGLVRLLAGWRLSERPRLAMALTTLTAAVAIAGGWFALGEWRPASGTDVRGWWWPLLAGLGIAALATAAGRIGTVLGAVILTGTAALAAIQIVAAIEPWRSMTDGRMAALILAAGPILLAGLSAESARCAPRPAGHLTLILALVGTAIACLVASSASTFLMIAALIGLAVALAVADALRPRALAAAGGTAGLLAGTAALILATTQALSDNPLPTWIPWLLAAIPALGGLAALPALARRPWLAAAGLGLAALLAATVPSALVHQQRAAADAAEGGAGGYGY